MTEHDKAMTKGEREDLQRLIRQREKVLISAAKQRGAELLADFENALAARFSFDDDAVWAEAVKRAKAELTKADKRIKARCAELGIPADFAPQLQYHWLSRGQNALKERREELRTAAKAEIAALEQRANADSADCDTLFCRLLNGKRTVTYEDMGDFAQLMDVVPDRHLMVQFWMKIFHPHRNDPALAKLLNEGVSCLAISKPMAEIIASAFRVDLDPESTPGDASEWAF